MNEVVNEVDHDQKVVQQYNDWDCSESDCHPVSSIRALPMHANSTGWPIDSLSLIEQLSHKNIINILKSLLARKSVVVMLKKEKQLFIA
mmetsp:Transcript_19597/g.49222  ORF Transcript_19597/g.49222 Transcript_19597/m.49222 type:complete len:89 (-) Transcript_19597:1704-1970(-)